MAETDDIVLGPKLGSANPFAQFGKGAGFSIKVKKVAAPVTSSGDDTAPKKDAPRLKYTKDFMLEFLERYTKCPVELHSLGMPEIVVSGDSERDQQREVLLKVAEEVSEADWRRAAPVVAVPAPSATPAAVSAAAKDSGGSGGNWDKNKPDKPEQQAREPKAPKQQQAPQQAHSNSAAAPESGKIVRAADSGQQAYKPGGTLTVDEKALRTMKGVLNKLTPEKFERLLQQLLEVITTAEFLKQTIALVFENAVEQPTFCAMYADLCLRLSKELPSFPPPPGSDKFVSFRQILLNTCQDEFEGTEAAREAAGKCTESHVRDEAERAVKKRTLGNVRLISELYKQDMVKDWIMTTCMEDLLVHKAGKVPPEHNIEACCEMITTAGMRLTKSDRADTKKKLDEVLKSLEKLGADAKNVPSRLRFVIKDVLDLKKSNWVPRREVFTARKLDEVRAQAEAELGMISSTIASSLPTLPSSQQRQMDDLPLIPPLRSGATEPEWGLFPPLRGSAAMPSSVNSSGGGAGKSALMGEYQAVATAQAAVTAPMPAPAAAVHPPVAASAPAPASQGTGTKAAPGQLSEEDLKRKTENLFNEFVSTLDKKEAVTCVQELKSPAWMPKLVEIGIDLVMNSTHDKEQDALLDLLIHFHAQGDVSSSDMVAGITVYTSQLEDFSMDYPKAPVLLGQLIGLGAASGALQLDVLPKLLEGDFGVEAKRDLAAAAFKALQAAKGGASGLLEACTSASLQASTFLTADASLDPSAPSVEAWLESAGFKGAVPL